MTRFRDLSVNYFRIIIATRRAHTRYVVEYIYFTHVKCYRRCVCGVSALETVQNNTEKRYATARDVCGG